ncbi:hypothetical protein [Polyangium sorediatum]|uniref:DUF2293 domain-containing protein n=1 Tax=Polyangium sorediatum TaxID=889274 RepID=A0ABT6NRT2_9BACT|nr:hypothetical protein [Polyangium sorediatum]MDI1431052.1 hypothetical protein [Polyangium sorediatum]
MDPQATKMNELFEAKRPALLALPDDILLRPRISRERAARLTGILRREFEPLLPLLQSELSASRAADRAADFAALEPNQLVFYAADLAVETPWTSDQKARRGELVAKVRSHDETLFGWAKPAFRTNKEASTILSDIQRGRGIRDDADDTLRLVSLFRSHWASVNGKTPITEADLQTAEAEATELLQILDGGDDPPKGSPRDLRRRAYTAWHRTYAEVFHLGRYLSRHDSAAARRFPAIAPERSESDADDELDAAEPAPAPPGG